MSGLNVKKHNNKTIKESDFLIRISENKYIESTRSGFLYMNPLSFFRKIEQKGVGDEEEGIMSTNGLGNIIYNGEVVAKVKNIKTFIDCPIFCASSIYLNQVEIGHYEYTFPSEMLKEFMPDSTKQYSLLLLQKEDFIQRIDKALLKKNLQGYTRDVKYTDEIKTFSQKEFYKYAFRKRPIYEYQHEWRLVINMGIDKNEHYILDIGDISDITRQYPIKNNEQGFKLEVHIK